MNRPSREVGAAFQQKVIAGAVTSELRIGANIPAKILLNLVDLGIPYSMNMIAVSREYSFVPNHGMRWQH